MHARQQIRSAVADALRSVVRTEGRVFASRFHKIEAQSLPCLLVYTLQETSGMETLSRPRGQARVVQVKVEIAAQQTDGLDDLLDEIAADVEARMAGDSTLLGLLRDIVLESTAMTLSGEGEQRAIGMALTYSAYYRTREGDPETIIS